MGGLSVVGISQHVGLEQLDAAALDRSLGAAREALQLLRERGFLQEERVLLDLGSGVSDANGGTFEHLAAVLHERLSHWLPTEAFGHVIIVADAGRQLGLRSTSLLTKVLSRSGATALPEPLPKDAADAAGVPQPCSILGPSGSDLDVILADASLPELEVGDWLLWRQLGGAASKQAAAWHYTEDISGQVVISY